MLKSILAAATLTLSLAVPGFAQTTPPAAQPGAASAGTAVAPAPGAAGQGAFLARQTRNEWRGSKLIGASVYGPGDTSIGRINELVVGDHGEVRAVVIGVGGFLGIGEKDVAVPFQALRIARKPNTSSVERITVDATKDELQKAPNFAYLKANGANNTTGGNAPRQH